LNVVKLTCREAARLLFGAADAALSSAERAALEAHIVRCEACERVQAQAELMQRASASWRKYRQDEG
jgi:Putative zinc-finger